MKISRLAAAIAPAALMALMFAGAANAQTLPAPERVQDVRQHQAVVAGKKQEAIQDDRIHDTKVDAAQAQRDHTAAVRASSKAQLRHHRRHRAAVRAERRETSPDAH